MPRSIDRYNGWNEAVTPNLKVQFSKRTAYQPTSAGTTTDSQGLEGDVIDTEMNDRKITYKWSEIKKMYEVSDMSKNYIEREYNPAKPLDSQHRIQRINLHSGQPTTQHYDLPPRSVTPRLGIKAGNRHAVEDHINDSQR